MKFTKEYQPNYETRPRRGRGKKQILSEEYKHLFKESGINSLEVKKELISILLSKETHSFRELELINKIVSDLLPYQMVTPDKQITIINKSDTESISTSDLIESFINEK